MKNKFSGFNKYVFSDVFCIRSNDVFVEMSPFVLIFSNLENNCYYTCFLLFSLFPIYFLMRRQKSSIAKTIMFMHRTQSLRKPSNLLQAKTSFLPQTCEQNEKTKNVNVNSGKPVDWKYSTHRTSCFIFLLMVRSSEPVDRKYSAKRMFEKTHVVLSKNLKKIFEKKRAACKI